jgi:hypothetical protein
MRKHVFKNRVPDRKPFQRETPKSVESTIDMLKALAKVSELAKQDF